MKNIGAKWLVEAAKYIADNPQFIVNGFTRAGICQALDGRSSDDELDELLCEMDSNEVSTSDEEEELCSNPSTYDLQAMDSNAGFDKPPVIVLYSSTSGDEDV